MVGSDSGRIVVLEYIPFKNVFERVIILTDIEKFIVYLRKIITIILILCVRFIWKHLARVVAEGLYLGNISR